MCKLKMGCIADDFTGGSDAASFLKKGGLTTLLINGDKYNDYTPDETIEAIVIALKTRSVKAEYAISQSIAAANWLLEHGAQQIYFKYCSTFDSTCKGNIGPVTDSLMEYMMVPYTILCPALPINGRTVTDGILYVNGIPLGESHMKFHPLNPMLESCVAVLMRSQSQYPCLTLNHQLLNQDARSIHRLLTDAAGPCGHATAVLDYDRPEQGAVLADIFGDMPLLTGGSGLLEHLARRYKNPGFTSASVPPAARESLPRLILAGSCSSMTQAQVKQYLYSGKEAVQLDPLKLLSGEQVLEDIFSRIRSLRNDLLVYSTVPAEALSHSSECDISAMLERTMGELASCAESAGIKRLIVAGGETSGAVTRRLEHAVFYIGNNAAPGVPVLIPVDRPDMQIVLKSGNFGNEDFFLDALC